MPHPTQEEKPGPYTQQSSFRRQPSQASTGTGKLKEPLRGPVKDMGGGSMSLNLRSSSYLHQPLPWASVSSSIQSRLFLVCKAIVRTK